MRRGPTIFLCALLLPACTRNNLDYTGNDDGFISVGGSHDLAGVRLDLAGQNPGSYDLTGAPHDLSGVSPADLGFGPTDMAPGSCADASCPCGCAGGHCVQPGTACGSGKVCTAAGCRTCGGTGQPCCASSTCNDGGCCNGDSCVPSGRNCTGSTATTQKVCLNGSCTACGTHSQPCCADDVCAPSLSAPLGVCCDITTRTCVNNGETCGTTTCGLMGSCGGCGGTGVGQTCCPPNTDGTPSLCSASKTTCVLDNQGNSDSCQACGGTNQPCCDGNACDSGGCCVNNGCKASGTSCAGGLGTCKNGACGTCGGLGQSCCTGDVCTATNAVCDGSSCVSCGGNGELCCADPSGGDGVFDDCSRPFAPMSTSGGSCRCGT